MADFESRSLGTDLGVPDSLTDQGPDARERDDREDLDDYGMNGGSLAGARKKYAAPIPEGGPLLEQPDEGRLFKTIEKEIKRQSVLGNNRYQRKRHLDFVRGGSVNSVLNKSEDQSVYRQDFILGTDADPLPVPNKINNLCNRVVSQIIVDVPLPKAIAEGDDDRSRMAQDITRKFLRQDGTPDGTNDLALFRDSLNNNITDASTFAVVWVDPVGGGWRPKQINAAPRAEDPSNPRMQPQLMNGQPVMDPMGKPVLERSPDTVLRYVGEKIDPATGQPMLNEYSGKPLLVFTNNPAEAARQWVPKHKRKMLTSSQVRLIPRTADAFTAHRIHLLEWAPLSEAKMRFPILNSVSKDDLKALLKWKPERWKEIVPPAMRPKGGDEADGGVHDDALFFWYHTFCRIGPEYRDGGEVAVTGGTIVGSNAAGFCLTRDTLREDVTLDDDTVVPVLMHPPVTQFKGLNDFNGGDPLGLPVIGEFTGAYALYAYVWSTILDNLDREAHPNVFLGVDSNVTREAMVRRDGTPIDITSKDDMPFYETVPRLDGSTITMLDKIGVELNSEAMLNETAEGLDSKYSDSGIAKQVSISQAKVALAQYWQNSMDGVTYYWTIKTQLGQARLTVPQQIGLAGQDSAFKQRWFVGADMVGMRKIVLQPGSGSMNNPTQKMQSVSMMKALGAMDDEEGAEIVRASMADDLGIQPSVHKERANRQVADWLEGPPKGWMEQYAANQQMVQQYQAAIQQAIAVLVQQGIDPQTAQQQASQQVGPPPQPTPMSTPFEPIPNEQDAFVAKIRAGVLSRFQSTVDYKEQPKPWRDEYDKAYNAAFTASGGTTVAETKAAQQSAAAAEAAKQDPNGTYQQFRATIDKAVVGKIAGAIAKEVAGGPEPVPDANAGEIPPALQLMADSADADAQRKHDATEAAKDREHEVRTLAISGVQKLRQDAHKQAITPPPPPPVARPAASTL